MASGVVKQFDLTGGSDLQRFGGAGELDDGHLATSKWIDLIMKLQSTKAGY
jgi:hypothetical protein